MALQILSGVFNFLFFLVIILFYYAGGLKRIRIFKGKFGPFVLVYDDHTGPYNGTSKIQNDIYNKLLKEHKIQTFQGFGIYYDNPKKVPKNELRSIAGCILEKKDQNKKKELLQAGFKIKEIKQSEFYWTEFPFRNSLSIMVGIMKVYPRFKKFLKKNNIKENEMMEIYDVPKKKIIYLMKE